MGINKDTYKLKNNKVKTTYRATVYVDSVRVASKRFSNKNDAIFWYEKTKKQYNLSPQSVNDNISFRECLTDFMEDMKLRVFINTFQKYEVYIQHFKYLQNVKMSELKGIKIVNGLLG